MKTALVCITVNGGFLLNEFIEHYYPICDSLIFVEGATQNWCKGLKLKSCNSTDNTLDIIRKAIKKDKQNKIFLHTQNTPYLEKLEQINYGMGLVPDNTDFVIQVDDDEYIMYEDFEKIKQLVTERNATYVEYKMINFFKSFFVVGRGGTSWAYEFPIPRWFKYHKGCKFTSHRPPTILNEQQINVKDIRPILADELEKLGIFCRHYSYIEEKRVFEKLKYYDITFPNAHNIKNYYYNVWFKKFWQKWTPENRIELEKIHSAHPTGLGAYTEPFKLKHPKVIEQFINNFKLKKHDIF
jgi:glycosyltransferase involved in cell wall biosynthesis